MPRIDDVDFKKKKFQKTELRSWDKDLVSMLTMSNKTDDNQEKPSILERNTKKIEPTVKNLTNVKIEADDNKEKLKKAPIIKHAEKKTTSEITFLDESFRLTKMIKRLGGNEDLVFTLVHNICKNLKSFKTGNISSNDFDEHLGITRNSRETALKRLCKKGLLKRYKGISGSKGMINIGLSEKTFEIAENIINKNEI